MKARWWSGLTGAAALLLWAASVGASAPIGARIYVASEGLIRFHSIRLQALGIDLAQIAPQSLRLTLRGQVVPLRVESTGSTLGATDTIEFLALPPSGGQANYDIYRLAWNDSPGISLPTLPDLPAAGAVELDQVQVNIPLRVPEGNLTAPRKYEIVFELPPDLIRNSRARVELELMGVSSLPNEPDHHLVVTLNDESLGELRWDGGHAAHFEAPTKLGMLLPARNILELSLPGDIPGTTASQQSIDGIEMLSGRVAYQCPLRPVSRGLAFETQESGTRVLYRAGADAQGPLWIYSSNGYRIPMRPLVGGTLGAVDFAIAGARNYLVGPENTVEPDFIEPIADLEVPLRPVDYVVIAPAGLFSAAEELASYRASQGLKVVAVRAEALYDRYSHSFPNPEALRDYLVELSQSFPLGPRFVVLLGDARKDYSKWQGFSARNLVPTFSIPVTEDEINASDALMVDLEGDDGIPEISIGRLPARSLVEARRLVKKIRTYEQTAGSGSWLARSLFVTGLPKFGNQANPFVKSSEELIVAELPGGYRPEKLFLQRSLVRDPRFVTDRVPDPAATKKILQLFDDGLGLAHYSGHGGLNVWEDRQLLTLDDVPNLKNGERLPLVISMSCFTAYFDDTDLGCIGEELVNAPGGGAIAFWGSTGRSSMQGNFQLSEILFRALFEPAIETVGQLFDTVKARFLDGGGNQQMADAYVLLGDPALHLMLPRPTLELTASLDSAGASLRVQGTSVHLVSGAGDLVLEDAQGRPVAQAPLTLSDHRVSGTLSLAQLTQGRYVARAAVWGSGSERPEVGSVDFFRQVPEILVDPTPSESFRDQPVTISAQIHWSAPIASAAVRWSWDRQNWRAVPLQARDPEHYVAEQGIAPPTGRQTLFYTVKAYDQSGVESETAERTLLFREHADLSLRALRTEPGSPVVALLRNVGDVPVERVDLELRLGDGSEDGKFLLRKSVPGLAARGQATVEFSGVDLPPDSELSVIVDPDQQVVEGNEVNNTLKIKLHQPAGSSWSLASGENSEFRLAGATAPAPTQPALQAPESNGWACRVEALRVGAPGPLQLSYGHAAKGLELFRWVEAQEQWVAVGNGQGQPSDSGLQAQVPGAGLYAALHATKPSEPRAEFFHDTESGRFWSLVSDPNGLDLADHPPRQAGSETAPRWYARVGRGTACLIQLGDRSRPDAPLIVTGFDGRQHRIAVPQP